MGFIAASCVVGFKQKVSTINGFRNQQRVFILIMSDIPPAGGVIFSLRETDISANAEVILYPPLKLGKTNITCGANITGVANITRRKANITEEDRGRFCVLSRHKTVHCLSLFCVNI